MTYSHTQSASQTFTLSHAKYLAGKVLADMDRCRQIYGKPLYSKLADYQEELIQLLRNGYIETYEFGFEDSGETRVVSWKYWVQFGDLVGGNDRPGSIYRRADIAQASFFNFVTWTTKWWELSDAEREAVESSLPFRRGVGNERKDGHGYWKDDKGYSSTGCLVTRKTFVPC